MHTICIHLLVLLSNWGIMYKECTKTVCVIGYIAGSSNVHGACLIGFCMYAIDS